MTSKLRETREIAGYSIEHVANKLNIRKRYLLALEEEEYDTIPGKIYVEGYKKMYHEFLGINSQAEQNENLNSEKIINSCDKIEGESKYRKYIIFYSIILFVLVVVFYNSLRLQ